MPDFLYGMHDREGCRIVPAGGWCVDTLALSQNPASANYAALRGDINWMVRLNWGYGSTGTIPLPNDYQKMANACANYVARSAGANCFIIGNEPNHENERPNGVFIAPAQYARCFVACRDAIFRVNPLANVIPAPLAPYHANPVNWLEYEREMLQMIAVSGGCGGIAMHAYTRSSNPADIASDAKMGPPLNGQYSGFRTYRDALSAVPESLRHLPAYVTEFDEYQPWEDRNTGVVQGAFEEINGWNQQAGTQKIHFLALYRWPKYDQWYIAGKRGVVQDFEQAAAKGYQSPMPNPDPAPQPQPPNPPTPQPPAISRDIDPRLIARGVRFDFATPPAGTGYWRIKAARWLDEQEADAAGPDHHILGQITRAGAKVAGVPFLVEWPSDHTHVVSKNDAGASFNYDYPMSKSLNEFSIRVDYGSPSDKASGIGMGANGNPALHTSTWIDWEWAIADTAPTPPEPEPGPPTPTPPILAGSLIWPVQGPITQRFGENPADYARFGQAGHNGVDIGVPEGTPVRAIADGEVMYTGTDPDYGNYCRVYHPSLHSHSFVAHLSAISTVVGAQVRQGQVIAQSGNTGNSSGPHLHFELRGGSRDAYYIMSYGYTQGRYDPQIAYLLTGSALTPGATRDRA